MKKKLIRWLIGILAVAIIIYAGIILFLITQETKLVYFVTYEKPVKVAPADSSNLVYNRIELKGKEGLKLIAWEIPSKVDSIPGPWLLFCHGNASDISYVDYVERYKLFSGMGFNTLAFDYRGFGESEGVPDEQGVYEDAMTSYEYLTMVKKIPATKIIIYGHSLGTGIAIELATRVPAAGLVVEAGYQSAVGMGQKAYPYLPISLVMKNRFISIDKVAGISMPKLIVHSPEDLIIPFSDGQALYVKASPPKSFLEIKGNHDAAPLQSREVFMKGLSSFVSETSARLGSK